MTDLYRQNGGAPQALPAIAYDADGQAWTDLANSAAARSACGFVKAPKMPTFDPATQRVEWDASAEKWVKVDLPPPPAPPLPSADDVTAERDRRMDAGLVFAGKRYQSRANDRENIAGAAQLAFMAVVAGALPGNLRWADEERDFEWIAEDNALVPMDAPTVIAFAKTAAGRKQALTLTARGIKDMAPIPQDFQSDSYWPA